MSVFFYKTLNIKKISKNIEKDLTETKVNGILNGHSRKKGMQKRKYTEKKEKKLKKCVDIEEKVWYINGATCKKSARSKGSLKTEQNVK